MRVFKIPFDVKREEKIFGGYLSLRQVIYIMIAASTLSILALHIPIPIKIIIISIISIFFLLCAFLKVKEQNFDRIFLNCVKYLTRNKKYVYERCQKW